MDYEYTVEDTRYEDHQYARYGTPTTAERATERFEARDRLAVYYLPGTPEDGSTTRPGVDRSNVLPGGALGGVFVFVGRWTLGEVIRGGATPKGGR
jgi:hypothetical protein